MANNNGYVIASLTPGWIKNEYRIIMQMTF